MITSPPVYKLGMKIGAPPPILKFGTYFNAQNLPPVPVKIGRPWLIRPGDWGMLGNDTVGDCVLAGGAHETMMLCADAGAQIPFFTPGDALADYSAITGYVPGDESTDQGTDPAEAAKYRRTVGLLDASGARHRIDVYADLRTSDLRQLALAVSLFGIAGVGVDLPDTAMNQFNNEEPWELAPGAKSLGGHYVPCIGRNTKGLFLFVTWGKIQAATAQWVRKYMVSGLVYFSRERLNAKGLSPQGFDLAKLNSDFAAVTA